MSEALFDFEEVFAPDDYLYFYGWRVTDAERSDMEAETIRQLLELEPGMAVLDLACGHGRIANRLAAMGCRVTGLDATPGFLEIARRDAAERGIEPPEYVEGDMRHLPWTERFDRIVNWFTAFGYFDDAENRQVLLEAHRALKPGGRLLIELNNRDWVLSHFLPQSYEERDGNYMLDHRRYDLVTGRMHTERTVLRDGRRRVMHFFTRMFTFTELRDWLLEAGFAEVEGYGERGEPLTLDSRRMLMVARNGS